MGGVAWRRLAIGIVCVFGFVDPVAAQDYPARPVTIVVPFGPGSVTDTTARLIAQGLQNALGRPVVVENKSGGGGLIAANAVAHAPADGYTLPITTNSTHSAAPGLVKSVPYDPIDAYVKTELVKWTSLIKEAGIEPE